MSAALYAQTTTETFGHAGARRPKTAPRQTPGRDRRQRRLRLAVGVDQPKRPVGNVVAATPPLVGPGERDRAAEAFSKCGAQVHRGDRALVLQALTDAVGASFGEQQRSVAGNLLQPREVGAKLRLAVQVDVERAHVEAVEVQVLRRREVDVRQQGSPASAAFASS